MSIDWHDENPTTVSVIIMSSGVTPDAALIEGALPNHLELLDNRFKKVACA